MDTEKLDVRRLKRAANRATPVAVYEGQAMRVIAEAHMSAGVDDGHHRALHANATHSLCETRRLPGVVLVCRHCMDGRVRILRRSGSLVEVPGGSVIIIIIIIIIIIMIRTVSQMENKLLENVSKKVEGPKEHTG